MATELRITTDRPTKPGWYWMKEPGCEPEYIRLRHYTLEEGFIVEQINTEEPSCLNGVFRVSSRKGQPIFSLDTKWYGPLPEPTETES